MARQSTIYLFNCWFLDVGHNHTVNFNNETNQLNFFMNYLQFRIDNCTYLRKERTLKVPKYIDELALCNYCAFQNSVDGKMVIDDNVCKTCGVCSESKCPFKAVKPHNEVVYQIYVGGTWGKKSRMGTPLSKFVSEDEIAPILEKTMIWFKLNANPKERLGVAIDRLGVEKFEKDVLENDELLEKKDILFE